MSNGKMAEFDAQEFFNLGLRLVNTFKTEAGYRTAIGRLYYACHLIGVRSTSKKGWFQPKYSKDDHRLLIQALKLYNKRAIADQLSALVVLREHADYHINKRSDGLCKLCNKVTEGCNLVDSSDWERAKSIAENILPKLIAIEPTNPEK